MFQSIKEGGARKDRKKKKKMMNPWCARKVLNPSTPKSSPVPRRQPGRTKKREVCPSWGGEVALGRVEPEKTNFLL